MKYKGLDDKEYSINLGKYWQQNSNSSELHKRAREFLKKQYPALHVLEEVYIESEKLRLDFFIPVLKIVIEANGLQHEKDNRFFYKDKMDFFKAKARDKKKAEWCRINKLRLIYFNHDEDESVWKNKLSLQD